MANVDFMICTAFRALIFLHIDLNKHTINVMFEYQEPKTLSHCPALFWGSWLEKTSPHTKEIYQ